MSANLAALLYLVAGVLFILALRGLSSPATSRAGQSLRHDRHGDRRGDDAAAACSRPSAGLLLIVVGVGIGGGVGAFVAQRIPMTKMPQLVAGFHALVGLAAVLVAAGAFFAPHAFGIGVARRYRRRQPHRNVARRGDRRDHLHRLDHRLPEALRAHDRQADPAAGAPYDQHLLGVALLRADRRCSSARESGVWLFLLILASFALGVTLIIPIGGADMPVVVSMLNSYSGWAAAGIGFTLGNLALIITGALVGSSGAILSYIMCKGMNRCFISVILGGFGGEVAGPAGGKETRPVKQGSADDAAYIMQNAGKVIIVPGYGMAVAQAQHALREMADMLKKEGVEVKYAIHPVAGRMPGHMNVLLAEANVPYDEVFELEDINSEFGQADVAFVIGANDVTNPAAKTDKTSAIYGMPILDVEKAKTVLFLKRGMGSGYAGVENELFFRHNTMMLFGDAKKTVESIVKSLAH